VTQPSPLHSWPLSGMQTACERSLTSRTTTCEIPSSLAHQPQPIPHQPPTPAIMSEKCGRCQKSVYANDNPQRVNDNVYHGACFKCGFEQPHDLRLSKRSLSFFESVITFPSILSCRPDQAFWMQIAHRLLWPFPHAYCNAQARSVAPS